METVRKLVERGEVVTGYPDPEPNGCRQYSGLEVYYGKACPFCCAVYKNLNSLSNHLREKHREAVPPASIADAWFQRISPHSTGRQNFRVIPQFIPEDTVHGNYLDQIFATLNHAEDDKNMDGRQISPWNHVTGWYKYVSTYKAEELVAMVDMPRINDVPTHLKPGMEFLKVVDSYFRQAYSQIPSTGDLPRQLVMSTSMNGSVHLIRYSFLNSLAGRIETSKLARFANIKNKPHSINTFMS